MWRDHDFRGFGSNLTKGDLIAFLQAVQIAIGRAQELFGKLGRLGRGHGSTLRQNVTALVENEDGLYALVRRQAADRLLQFEQIAVIGAVYVH